MSLRIVPLCVTISQVVICAALIVSDQVCAKTFAPVDLLSYTRNICEKGRSLDNIDESTVTHSSLVLLDVSELDHRGDSIGKRYTIRPKNTDIKYANDAVIKLDVVDIRQHRRQIISFWFEKDLPSLLINLRPDCSIGAIRRINYSENGQAHDIEQLDASFNAVGEPDLLNPALNIPVVSPQSRSGGSEKRLRVGMIDSGVNYLIPSIAKRLARTTEGELVGYDFWDMDNLPFDANLVGNGFRVQRHGTQTASLLLKEAPEVDLVPYRYPRPTMSRMRALVEHADRNEVHILGMPMGSNKSEEWEIFATVAARHPHILFIVSAGNNGRDIDKAPVFPAALDLPNMLVVTSSDDYVRPADRSNWGVEAVDYLIPAEFLETLDFNGRLKIVSGSSYAVSRLTALAANIKIRFPGLTAMEIAEYIHENSALSIDEGTSTVKLGFIPDPLAFRSVSKGLAVSKNLVSEYRPGIQQSGEPRSYRLMAELLLLDNNWALSQVEQASAVANELFAQCDISIDVAPIYRVFGDEYLEELTIGSSYTLLSQLKDRPVTVVFAKDNKMLDQFAGLSFGQGNTRNRRWLQHSVWLMPDVVDVGLAMAHELFHVLANSGDHSDAPRNLMQTRTTPSNVKLSRAQCARAVSTGLHHGLIERRTD